MTESNETRNDPPRTDQSESRRQRPNPGETFSRAFNEMFGAPPTAGEHFRQARIEFLRGIRDYVDYRIERIQGKGQRPQ